VCVCVCVCVCVREREREEESESERERESSWAVVAVCVLAGCWPLCIVRNMCVRPNVSLLDLFATHVEYCFSQTNLICLPQYCIYQLLGVQTTRTTLSYKQRQRTQRLGKKQSSMATSHSPRHAHDGHGLKAVACSRKRTVMHGQAL